MLRVRILHDGRAQWGELKDGSVRLDAGGDGCGTGNAQCRGCCGQPLPRGKSQLRARTPLQPVVRRHRRQLDGYLKKDK